MLNKEKILELLNSLHEHKMAKDIFVPVLKKMGCKGVKFTGGPDEVGIDIEYYELTQPENLKSYVGVQFKKGNLVYSSGGSKNSVKEVKNQTEEAFDKEIHDIKDHATYFISRFVVATTGDINEKARTFIGKARQKGNSNQPGTIATNRGLATNRGQANCAKQPTGDSNQPGTGKLCKASQPDQPTGDRQTMQGQPTGDRLANRGQANYAALNMHS